MNTPEQYYILCATKYPSLFHRFENNTLNKLAILDQLLNVSGNGINNSKTFFKEINAKFNSKYLSLSEIPYRKRVCGFRKSNYDFITCWDNEISSYPDVAEWKEMDIKSVYHIYPNFNDQYSVLKDIDYNAFSKDVRQLWIQDFIWFYSFAKEKLNSDECHLYFDSCFPSSNKKDLKHIMLIIDLLSKYKNYQEISEAYKLDFRGNYYTFAIELWQRSKTAYVTACDSNIEFLKRL